MFLRVSWLVSWRKIGVGEETTRIEMMGGEGEKLGLVRFEL